MLWCLHGALGSAADWETLSLPDAHPVDLWGTPPAPDMFTWASAWSAAVAEHDASPQLLGYSLGGRLALHALLVAPALWQRAVIVSAHPGLRDPDTRAKRRQRDTQWAQRFLTEPHEDVLRDWNAQDVFGKHSIQARNHFAPAMARGFQDWSLGNQEPLWERLSEIQIPIHWVCGEEDSKFVTLGEEAVARIPNAQCTIAPACGHRVPWEWEAFAEHIAHVCGHESA